MLETTAARIDAVRSRREHVDAAAYGTKPEAVMKNWIALLASVLLLGCAAVEPAPPAVTEAVFHDVLFVPPAVQPDARELFAVTPAMKRYLADRIEPRVRRQGAQRGLLDALYTQGELRLEYDAARTRTAAEAFDARRGNCLSLVLMTAAFAREMGLAVRFHEVLGTPVVERDGELTFVVGHVNLALGESLRDARTSAAHEQWLVVDFLPGQDLQRQHRRAIDERRIAAMFMNNRAAEELARGRVDEAYWWLRGAHAQDPGFANLYNTLGVVYRRHGELALAEQALQLAQAMDPDNEHVAGNLASLRQSTLAQHHHRLAVDAATRGDLADARRHLQQAASFSPDEAQRSRYAAKLRSLKGGAVSPVLQ